MEGGAPSPPLKFNDERLPFGPAGGRTVGQEPDPPFRTERERQMREFDNTPYSPRLRAGAAGGSTLGS